MTLQEASMLLREYAYKVTNNCTSPAWQDTRISVQDCIEIANLLDETDRQSNEQLRERIKMAVNILTGVPQ